MLVDKDVTLSAGDRAPDWVRGFNVGALDCALAVEDLAIGGRIECFFKGTLTPSRGIPAMVESD